MVYAFCHLWEMVPWMKSIFVCFGIHCCLKCIRSLRFSLNINQVYNPEDTKENLKENKKNEVHF